MQGTMSRAENRFDLVPSFRPNERVRLLAASPIHRAVYEAVILAVQPGVLRVSLPEEHGRLVFIPVGTTVQLFRSEGDPAGGRWVVSDREGGPQRSLLLIPPHLWRGAQTLPAPRTRVMAVSSGKGGVGKSVLALNLALGLAELGSRVCLVDADLGTANLDVLLNLNPRSGLEAVVRGQSPLRDVLVPGPGGITLLPGASATLDIADLDEGQLRQFYGQLAELDELADLILIDTGAGLSRRVTTFLLAAGETLLVTTPEPHAITDAYALLKVMTARQYAGEVHLVVAMSRTDEQAESVARKMLFAAQQFLGLSVRYLGSFPFDPAVPASVRQQQPFLMAAPHSRIAQATRLLASRLLDRPVASPGPQGLARLLHFLRDAGAAARSATEPHLH